MNHERFEAIGNATKYAQLGKPQEGDRTFATFGLAANNTQDEANFYSVVIFDATAGQEAAHNSEGKVSATTSV